MNMNCFALGGGGVFKTQNFLYCTAAFFSCECGLEFTLLLSIHERVHLLCVYPTAELSALCCLLRICAPKEVIETHQANLFLDNIANL